MKSCFAVTLALFGCAGVGGPAVTRWRSELVLHCTPTDAEVHLDGVPQGVCSDFAGTPRGLALGRGGRRVEVKKPGFVAWQRWLDADDTRVVMQVTLEPNGERAP